MTVLHSKSPGAGVEPAWGFLPIQLALGVFHSATRAAPRDTGKPALLAQPFTIESSSDPLRTVQPRDGCASAAGACALCCRCCLCLFFLAASDRGCYPERSIETYGRLQTEIPQARAALDRQFRTLLGVVTPPALTELASRTPSVQGR